MTPTSDQNEAQSSSTGHSDNNSTRTLEYQTRLQEDGVDEITGSGPNNSTVASDTDTETNDPDLETTTPATTIPPSPSPIEGSFGATFAPTIVSSVVATLVPTLAAGITGSTNNTIDSGDFPSPTFAPTLPPGGDTDALLESTKNYFKSPGFALAMVVNVSVFFAFTGLLKFYHAVRDDLKWCRPWPKFLTIKGVVFVTFWQGLAIVIFVVVLADPSEKVEATYRAHQYQDILICMEMLFFSISQWVSAAGTCCSKSVFGGSLFTHLYLFALNMCFEL
jgi:hypothetical protein